MTRANVTVVIDDNSYVIPGSESGSLTRAGFPSQFNLIGAIGNTGERLKGWLEVDNLGNWINRLTSKEPIGLSSDSSNHIGNLSGGTGSRWPYGPTGSWKAEWWACHN